MKMVVHLLALLPLLAGCALMDVLNNMPYRTNPQNVKSTQPSEIQKIAVEVFEKEFVKKTLYAGGNLYRMDMSGSFTNGEPFKIRSYEVKSIKQNDGLIEASFLAQASQGKVELPIELRLKILAEKSSLEDFSAFDPEPIAGNYFSKTVYQKDPLQKYRKNKAIVRAVQKEYVFEGMPEDAVEVALGAPERKNLTHINGVDFEQWVYHRKYVYLKNGIVTGWQNHN